MPWYKQSGAFQRRAAVNHQLRWPFARGDGELPLLKAGKSAILGPKPPESGECRLRVERSASTPPETALLARPSQSRVWGNSTGWLQFFGSAGQRQKCGNLD
jgi:hypothetical protein